LKFSLALASQSNSAHGRMRPASPELDSSALEDDNFRSLHGRLHWRRNDRL